MKRATVLIAFVWVEFCWAQQLFDGKSWWRHVEVLAGDNMEGRGIASAGLQRAEAYVVDQLQKFGLAPAGTDGYYQRIRFESRQVVEVDSRAALVRNGKAEPLALGEDAFFGPLVDLAPEIDAPLVFLGYGVSAAEENYDDFAGLDLKGKIAVTIAGAPEGINGPSLGQRWRQFYDAGLIGWILVPSPNGNWSRGRRDAAQPFTSLDGDEWNQTAGIKLFMSFNPARADKLFEGSGHTLAKLFALANDRKPLPRFPLPVSIRAAVRMPKRVLESANIVAKIEGSDPKLKSEYLVLSAHIDHLGIGAPVNGDAIYNGALDNASGCAALLDIASELRRKGTRPRRTLLFVFFTGEELGELGSKYFTARPTVDMRSVVGNINVDNIAALIPMRALVVQGIDESDIGDAVRRVAASQNILIDSEPELYPSRFFATISDQASFVNHGVPAVKPLVGFPGELSAVMQKWRSDVYHTPFDDLKQQLNLETAGKFEDFLLQLLLDVGNNTNRPQWKPKSIYKP